MTGEPFVWNSLTFNFEGPQASETEETFLNYRLSVSFSIDGVIYEVPGYFAADGNAGHSHATSGNIWRAKFTPDRPGVWSYQATLVYGEKVAIDASAEGETLNLTPVSGTFEVSPQAPQLEEKDFRNKGRLQYVGKRYLQFAGSGQYFLKGGAGSPENFLAFDGFDGTWDAAKNPEFPSLGEDQLHHFSPHRKDWKDGHPNWSSENNNDSKGIIGMINYLSAQGVNSMYFMPLTLEGDGCDVWPWMSPEDYTAFDVSKLDQWEQLFQHMQHNGIHLHLLLTETENESLFEIREGATAFANSRKLYYRELIARFGHHLALTWNLGEENGWEDEKGGIVGRGNTSEQRHLFVDFIRELDPYHHAITVHEIEMVDIYTDLLGKEAFNGPSLQRHEHYNAIVQEWIQKSEQAGHPWIVSMDEPLGWEYGLKPDADDPEHDIPRQEVLWGTLMAGGYGVDWYFGWQNNAPTSDLSSEDMRVRENMWKQTKVALDFFNTHVPFSEMEANNPLLSHEEGYVLAKPNENYLVYLKEAIPSQLNLSDAKGSFHVSWFDPKNGGELQTGSVRSVDAGAWVDLGPPPSDPERDWAVLLKR